MIINYLIFISQYSILTSQYSILTSQYSILNTHISILTSQYSILTSQYYLKMNIRIIISFLVLGAAFPTTLYGQEMGFEEYNPVSTLKVPGNEIQRAKYPFIDVHGHQYRMPTQDLDPLIADMDKLNMAIM